VKGSGHGLILYSGIVLVGHRKTMKTVGQDSLCSNLSPAKAVPLKILCAGTVSQSKRQFEGATQEAGSEKTAGGRAITH
jgi:hypothetical protein